MWWEKTAWERSTVQGSVILMSSSVNPQLMHQRVNLRTSAEPLTPLKPLKSLKSLRLLQEGVDSRSQLPVPGSSRHESGDSLCRMQPQFARMRPQVLAYFQLHAVKFSQVAAHRQAIIGRVGLNLSQLSHLSLEVLNPLQSHLKFLIVSNHLSVLGITKHAKDRENHETLSRLSPPFVSFVVQTLHNLPLVELLVGGYGGGGEFAMSSR